MITVYKNDVKEEFDYEDVVSRQRIKYHLKVAHGNNCMLCGVKISETYYCSTQAQNTYTIEHVRTRARYPKEKNSYSNMIGVCYECNNKRDNTIEVLNICDIEKLHEHIYTNPATGLIHVKEGDYKEDIQNLIDAYKLNRTSLAMQRVTCLKVIKCSGIDKFYEELFNFNCIMFKYIILTELELELHD